MEKIIILSDKPRRSYWLAARLKTLFPECDVITALGKHKAGSDNYRQDTNVKSANTRRANTRILAGHE